MIGYRLLPRYNQLLGAHCIYLVCSWLALLYLLLFLKPAQNKSDLISYSLYIRVLFRKLETMSLIVIQQSSEISLSHTVTTLVIVSAKESKTSQNTTMKIGFQELSFFFFLDWDHMLSFCKYFSELISLTKLRIHIYREMFKLLLSFLLLVQCY